jgi:hypothetical protein
MRHDYTKNSKRRFVLKIENRDKLKSLKPLLKGVILTLIGIYITRQGIGIGRFSTNLLYGVITYTFFSISGLILIKILQMKDNPSNDDPITILQYKILSLALFIGGTFITIGYIIFYNLALLTIIPIACIGIIWLTLYIYATKKRKSNIAIKTMFSLMFSMGLIYGAILNNIIMPLYVYIFFSALTFSQFSREINKDLFIGKRSQKPPTNKISLEDSLRLSLLIQALTILCLILALIAGLTYPILYLYQLILPLILLGLALYLTYKSRKEGKIYEKSNVFLKFGILFEVIAILLSN